MIENQYNMDSKLIKFIEYIALLEYLCSEFNFIVNLFFNGNICFKSEYLCYKLW